MTLDVKNSLLEHTNSYYAVVGKRQRAIRIHHRGHVVGQIVNQVPHDLLGLARLHDFFHEPVGEIVLELDHLAFAGGAEAQVALAVVAETLRYYQRIGPSDQPFPRVVVEAGEVVVGVGQVREIAGRVVGGARDARRAAGRVRVGIGGVDRWRQWKGGLIRP